MRTTRRLDTIVRRGGYIGFPGRLSTPLMKRNPLFGHQLQRGLYKSEIVLTGGHHLLVTTCLWSALERAEGYRGTNSCTKGETFP